MSVSRRPTLSEIASVLGSLSENVSRDSGASLDPILSSAILRASTELRRHIPGLVPAADPAAARRFATASRASLSSGNSRRALAAAVTGLAHAPHDPELHYLVGSACFELGAVKAALSEIGLALWVNPGYEHARRDLEALTAFWHTERDRPRRQAKAPRAKTKKTRKTKTKPAEERPLPFEFLDDDVTGDDSVEGDRAA